MAQVTLDAVANLLAVTPIGSYNAVQTAITISTADAAKLPTVPFNLVWWQSSVFQLPGSDPNWEIIRCTNNNTGTGVLTTIRAAEGPNGASTKSGGGTYTLMLGITAKMISDIQTGLSNTAFPVVTITVPNSGNNVALTVTQNDTTDNPDALDIVNAGTGKSFKVTNGATEQLTFTSTGLFGIQTPSPSSTLTVGGSFERAYRAISASRVLDITDDVIECTTGTFPVTLPTAVGISGREYTIKNTGTGTITVGTTSSQTIDGNLSLSLATQYISVTVMSNGANWLIV